MSNSLFGTLFSDLYFPVIVCRKQEGLPVVYVNIKAELFFAPFDSVESLTGKKGEPRLTDYLKFRSPEEAKLFDEISKGAESIEHYITEVVTFDGKTLPVAISGKIIVLDGEEEFVVFYFVEQDGERKDDTAVYNSWSIAAINVALLAGDVEEAINIILGYVGSQLDASRAYVFEEISETATRNTYEWCAESIEPAIQELQYLKKSDYNYDTIVKYEMYVANDVRVLPEEDRVILQEQGIKSVAIIAIHVEGKAAGYFGVDDCMQYRKWSNDEIRFLKTISSLISLLIMRRNGEQSASRGMDILQLMSDNSDEVVYVNTLDDYTIWFVSKALADSMGKTQDELLGKRCWEVLQLGQTGPCEFCPIPKIGKEGEDKNVYVWEYYNPIAQKTYLIKDSIIKWVDGTDVHMETAIDMTPRMEYEEKLQYLASVDAMTGIYNRQQGTFLLEEKLQDPENKGSLCFLDIDGLKYTNDHFGHHVGDELLIDTVQAICANLGSEDFVCRWGGDEFLVWFAGDTNYAESVVQKIQQNMEKANDANGKQYTLSFSYGIVPFNPEQGVYLDELVTRSDELMYIDKMEKRGKLQRRRRTD